MRRPPSVVASQTATAPFAAGFGRAVIVLPKHMIGVVSRDEMRDALVHEVASRFVGGRVGAEALKVLLAMEQGSGPLTPLVARDVHLKIPRRAPRPERVAEARAIVEKSPKGVDPTVWTFAKETVVLDARIKKEPVADVELQAIQVGPLVLLSCPAEYFCAYGLEMKSKSKFPFTFPVSLANDGIGYVPTEEALGAGGGGYETRLTSYSNLEPKAGRTIANTLIDMARELTPGPVPTSPALPKFKGVPWPYGSLGPEVD